VTTVAARSGSGRVLLAMRQSTRMVPEAPLEPTKHGCVPQGEGWFVVNLREARLPGG
jgi:hypothetical protein